MTMIIINVTRLQKKGRGDLTYYSTNKTDWKNEKSDETKRSIDNFAQFIMYFLFLTWSNVFSYFFFFFWKKWTLIKSFLSKSRFWIEKIFRHIDYQQSNNDKKNDIQVWM